MVRFKVWYSSAFVNQIRDYANRHGFFLLLNIFLIFIKVVMNDFQCLLFGIGWLIAAMLMGKLIRVGFSGKKSGHRTGLLLILFSFVCGITMLGVIISSLA